jgi:hypothetical protein
MDEKSESERDAAFLKAVDKAPRARIPRPSKRQGAGFGGGFVVIAIGAKLLLFANQHGQTEPSNAYLECIANARSGVSVPTGSGITDPTQDPNFGVPSSGIDPVGSDLNPDVSACSQYAH